MSALPTAVLDPGVEVGGFLDDLLRERTRELIAIDAALAPFAQAIAAHVLCGGKRLRPIFVALGYRAARGGDRAIAARAGAAVELVHAYALLHDDVMDRSDTRRGRPSFHRVLEACHREQATPGDSQWFGVSAAVLAGDLVAAWADELVAELPVDPPTLRRAQRVYAALRREAAAGQYLDLWRPSGDDDWRRVALLKSARYSVTHPLAFGAALAGRDVADDLSAALATYGDAVGLAFQLRDDVLGLFGDPSSTGKSNLDDVRQGKRTLLVSTAERLATPAQRAVLDRTLGDPSASSDAVDRVRDVVASCGASDHVERVIGAHLDAAIDALRTTPCLDPLTADSLVELARLATARCR